jgi:hypothetical protein
VDSASWGFISQPQRASMPCRVHSIGNRQIAFDMRAFTSSLCSAFSASAWVTWPLPFRSSQRLTVADSHRLVPDVSSSIRLQPAQCRKSASL